jgi:hypothetical protein
MAIVQNSETPANYVISADGRILFIRIQRADPFRRSPEELAAEHRGQLTQLRSVPGNEHVIREFWAYSKSGTWRFFRVEDTWLLEIGRDGLPLAVPAGKPVPENPGKDKKD